MNGFANSVLSLLLGWIRTLISNIWTVLNSEDGGFLYRFLSANWLTLVILICAAGIAVDVIVYFIRWRPHYVWQSRWRRLRKKRPEAEPVCEEPPVFSYEEEPAQPDFPQPSPTMTYAPLTQPTQVYQPLQNWQEEEVEPVFDEEAVTWEDGWQPEDEPDFGMPKPEPIHYFRDVQAGFAPAVAPEKLYQPSPTYQPPVQEEAAPVHPGLDEETFRQSIGLAEEEIPASYAAPVMRAPVFRPFTAVQEEPEEPAQNPFARFAKKAMSFVGMEDENNPRTIRDLQSTVDVSKAFHEPVYPQSMTKDE